MSFYSGDYDEFGNAPEPDGVEDEELEALDEEDLEEDEDKPGIPPAGSLDSLTGVEETDDDLETDQEDDVEGLFQPDE